MRAQGTTVADEWFSTNIVNAPAVAKERGIAIETITSSEVKDFANLVQVEVTTEQGKRSAVGTIFGHKFPRIISLDGFRMELIPEGHVVVCFNDDKPGVIGKVGDIFGKAGREFLGSLPLPSIYRTEVDSYLSLIDQIDSFIKKHLKKISKAGGESWWDVF